MIECAHCGTQNRKGSTYCSNCGQCLNVVPDLVCHACGRLSPSGSTFCQFCGSALSTAGVSRPQAPEGAEASRPARLGETGAAIPEAAGASQKAEPRRPTGQGPSTGAARKVPPWLYDSKPAAEIKQTTVPPVASVRPESAQSKGKAAAPSGNKYLEGIGDVLAPADGWLPSGSK